MCHSLNNWYLKRQNVFLQAFGSQVSDKGECTNREELQLKVKKKHVITTQTIICKLVFFNDLTMLWSFLQNTFSSRPFRYSSRYFCGSKAEDDFVVAKYNTLESVKRHITCKHGNRICAENMWVLNTDVSRPGAKGALAFISVSGTILLEVLLVRSVPCRLGISSDMALSCCLSFVNLWKKCKYWKCLSLSLRMTQCCIPQKDRRTVLKYPDQYANLDRGSKWIIILCL